MKLLVDFSQLSYRTFVGRMDEEFGNPYSQDPEYIKKICGKWKHVLLSSLLKLKREFKVANSSDVFLCMDHRISWRKQVFPHYKANRKKSRDKSRYDFSILFGWMDDFEHDLRNVFPFRVFREEQAEGDDWIGFFANVLGKTEQFVIVSSDSDFYQLHDRPGFYQQKDPIQNRILSTKSPKRDLLSKILGGDPGDGIPNVSSDEDTFVDENKRQKPMGEKRIGKILESSETLKTFLDDKVVMDRFNRNRILIDLNCIPESVQTRMNECFNAPIKAYNNMKLKGYLSQHDLIVLTNRLMEF